MKVCEVYGPYHTYNVPTEGGRRCACGSPQVYRPPTGSQSNKFSDVLVDKADLRDLIRAARAPYPSAYLGLDSAVDRVEELLD